MPTASNWFGDDLAGWLRGHDDDAEMARRTSRFRMSQAGKCYRQIAFEAIGFPRDIAWSDDTIRAFSAGDVWHSMAQSYLAAIGCETEVECYLTLQTGEKVIGHADAWDEAEATVHEIKTIARFGFEKIVNGTRGEDPEGPRADHCMQVSLYREALGAKIAYLHYCCKDDGRWATFQIDDDGGTGQWLASLRVVAIQVDAGLLPPRKVPGYGVVESPPASGTKGQPWQCRYCPYQPTCATLPSKSCPVPPVAVES